MGGPAGARQNGRDADLAFYVTRHGKPAVSPGLRRFDQHLSAPGGYRFDLPRNWALVRALLTHPTIQVQWIFAAHFLKRALLDWALAHEKDHDLVLRAAHVLHQPSDSLSHDDHFHIRLYCSKQDSLEGCRNFGPTWSWIQTFDRERNARIATLLAGLSDPQVRVRLGCLAFLERLHATSAARGIAAIGLADHEKKMVLATMDLLARWKVRKHAVLEALIRRLSGRCLCSRSRPVRPGSATSAPRTNPNRAMKRRGRPGGHVTSSRHVPSSRHVASSRHVTPSRHVAPSRHVTPSKPLRCPVDLDIAMKGFYALAHIGSSESVPFLARALRSKRVFRSVTGQSLPEALLAARASLSIVDIRLIPSLIAALDSPSPGARVASIRALRRITNRTFGYRWAAMRSPRSRRRAMLRWRRWYRPRRNWSRRKLVLTEMMRFRSLRRSLRRLTSLRALSTLVAMTGRHDHMGFNASWLLTKLCKCHGGHGRMASARRALWRMWLAKIRRQKALARRRRRKHRKWRHRSRVRPGRAVLGRRRARRSPRSMRSTQSPRSAPIHPSTGPGRSTKPARSTKPHRSGR